MFLLTCSLHENLGRQGLCLDTCSLQASGGNTDIVRNFILITMNDLAAQLHAQKVSPLELTFCRERREWVYNSADKKNCILLEQL